MQRTQFDLITPMETILFNYNELKTITKGHWLVPPKDHGGVCAIVTDSREDCDNSLFIALEGGNFDGHHFVKDAVRNGASVVCVARKYARAVNMPQTPVFVVDDTLKAYQNLAEFYRKKLKNLTIIALTGSNGKTSTKEILRTVLAAAFGEKHVYATKENTNNHIGVPQNLLNLNEKHRVAIIEMGTNHPGEIEVLSKIAKPDIGLITSIGPAHLEFFKDIEGVAREKASIFTGFSKTSIAIIPSDSPCAEILESAASPYQTLYFGAGRKADLHVKYLDGNLKKSEFELYWSKTKERRTVSWRLPGKHQAINAAAAALAATALGINPDIISNALKQCSALPGMRMRIRENNGVTWINDAYNANPDSMEAAISCLAELIKQSKAGQYSRIFIFLGDMLEMGKTGLCAHKQLLKFVSGKLPEAALFAVGPIMSGAAKNSRNFSCVKNFRNSEEAGKYIRDKLKKNDLVFLKGSRGMTLEKIEQISTHN